MCNVSSQVQLYSRERIDTSSHIGQTMMNATRKTSTSRGKGTLLLPDSRSSAQNSSRKHPALVINTEGAALWSQHDKDTTPTRALARRSHESSHSSQEADTAKLPIRLSQPIHLVRNIPPGSQTPHSQSSDKVKIGEDGSVDQIQERKKFQGGYSQKDGSHFKVQLSGKLIGLTEGLTFRLGVSSSRGSPVNADNTNKKDGKLVKPPLR